MLNKKSKNKRFIERFNPRHVKPFSDKDWTDRLGEIDRDASMLCGYIDCIDRLVPKLDSILEKAETFEQLKEEITKFSAQQKAFRISVENKWCQNPLSDQQYGLPSIC